MIPAALSVAATVRAPGVRARRCPVFSRWDEIERYEWQGDTLVFHLAATGLAHVGGVRAIYVPPERRGDVLAIIAPRLRG